MNLGNNPWKDVGFGDDPWKDVGVTVQGQDVALEARKRLCMRVEDGTVTQLTKCPTCLALVVEGDLDVHLQRLHAGVRIPAPFVPEDQRGR